MRVDVAVPGLASLHARTTGDPRIRVAVLDGPVDRRHPCFFGARLIDVPTLVSDVAGSGRMARHGTHVASLLFGQPGSSVPGVAPGCTGLLLPVFREQPDDRLPQLDLARAIERAVIEGAHVINISGGEPAADGLADPVLDRALRLCAENNVLVVAAAGNDSCACLHVPAAVPSVLAVGALAVNGRPVASSNWGAGYRTHGVVAPGELLTGAKPGGGVVDRTGTSYATPVVAGVAALLLSLQADAGQGLDPSAVGAAIVATARTCRPDGADDCDRYLAGSLDVVRASARVGHGRRTIVANTEGAAAVPRPADGLTGTPPPGVTGRDVQPQHGEAAPPTPASCPVPGPPAGYVLPVAASGVEPASAVPPTLGGTAAIPTIGTSVPYALVPAFAGGGQIQPAGVTSALAVEQPMPPVMSPAAASAPSAEHVNVPAPAHGVTVSDGCSCRSGSQPMVCDCQQAGAAYVYALGSIGFDFGTEARRDTFRQLMPDVRRQDGDDPPVFTKANPYDPFQLADYLDGRPSESTKLIWTLNLDLTPIYAVEAEPTYPEEVYGTLREALRRSSLPVDDDDYVARVSIPGVLTNRTVQLFSGQVVPVVVCQPRGLYAWAEKKLVDGVIDTLRRRPDLRFDEEHTRRTIRMFLDKVYFQCRNLGQAPSDRALNFAATNAYQFGEGIAEGFLSGITSVPGAEEELYTLDTIEVTKSPYCRVDSDCWDVRVRFFDPVNDRRAKSVYQFTIDVSDALPVTLAPYHRYLTA